MTQGDAQWLRDKAGKFSGSRFGALMSKTKSGAPTAGRQNLITQLAIERVIETCVETYSNATMEAGIEREPELIRAYEDDQLVVVQSVDFIQHPKLDYVGVSPDGLIGDDGGIEGKFRAAEALHFDVLRRGFIQAGYRWQIQGTLWVTDRQWWDYVSYHPLFPDPFKLAIVRVERDEKAIKELEAECIAANEEVEEQVRWFRERQEIAA